MLICSGVAYDDSDSPSALQYVHRNFFARAILESAAEPLRSPFAPSFLATYRTATTKLKLLTKFYDVSSDSLNKWAPMWSSALISGVSRYFDITYTRSFQDASFRSSWDPSHPDVQMSASPHWR